MSVYRPNVKGRAHPKPTRASSRKRNEKPPRSYWLDIGKLASLELTAQKFGFPYFSPDDCTTAKMDVDLYVCRNQGDRS